jgi:hypothetical protein
MSQIYTSAFVIILAQVLPVIGVNLGNDQLTQFAQIVISIVLGAWIMIRRKQQGDITALGSRKR